MKRPLKSLCVLFFVVAIGCTFSCSDPNLRTTKATVPELLQRSDKIQLGKEWEFVQNYYSQQKRALVQKTDDPEPRLNLAQLFVKEARVSGEHGHYYPAALQMTDEVLATADSVKDIQFRALLVKSGVQLSLHEFADALETAKRAIQINPYNAQIYGVLVDCYVELGDYKTAVAMADKMVSIKPDIRSYSRISYLREIHGDYPGAIVAMQMAIKAGYPGTEETAWAMQTLGELYQLYGETEKAKDIFQAILIDREDYPFAVGGLATLAYENGELSEAESITIKSMNIIPEVGFYVQMAQIHKAQNRNKEFSAIVNEIFLMLKDDVDSGHNMNLEYADVYLNLLDDPNKALLYAEKEYQKRPNNIDVNRAIANIYAAKGEISKSHEHIEVASSTDSKHPQLEILKELTKYEEQYSSL